MWERIGKVSSFREALGMVLENRTRYGRLVLSQSPELEAKKSERNKEILEEHLKRVGEEEEATREKKGKQAAAKLEQLKLQREILTAMTRYGDRSVHVTELAAAAMLVHGISSEKLRPYYNALDRMARKTPPPFSGAGITPVLALKDNALAKIFSSLAEGKAVSGKALADLHRFGRSHVAAVTALLDLCGAVHKLPMDSSTQSVVWTHARNPLPQPTWNTPYKILLKIHEMGEAQRISFSRPKKLMRVQARAPLGSYSSIMEAFDTLQRAGLIVPSDPKRRTYALTPKATAWVVETLSSGVLHPSLREALLGSVEVGKPPLSPRREEMILVELRARLLRARQPELSAREVGRLVGRPTNVSDWFREGRERTTLKNFSSAKLLEIADYFEGKGLAEEADYLRRFAAAREVGKFRSR
ncbi:MAG: hypothetical protein AB1626_02835 [Candidatus Micrarchaeota archaeon]